MCHLKNKKGLPLNPCRLFLICEGNLQTERHITIVKSWKCRYSGASIQGTPPFRGHKIWSGKNGHIIFVSVTSIIEILVLPQHEQFYPEGLSVFSPFSLEFYLNYKVSIEIQGLSSTDCNFQGLSRCTQTLLKGHLYSP